mmetsp:Transcript_42740/g.106580  ORF Transcript_42740/g.106580 Transcript_42740/m.106580 type:complete len:135 (+) Transcript_42740:512-916(+)
MPSGLARSSSWLPRSTTAPSWITAIESALRIVESRCAIITVVRFCFAMISSSATCTTRSDSLSSADVASSSSSTDGLRTIARAIATRCFCPPDSCTPRSPTIVPKPSEKAATKSSAFAVRAAASTAASSTLARP